MSALTSSEVVASHPQDRRERYFRGVRSILSRPTRRNAGSATQESEGGTPHRKRPNVAVTDSWYPPPARAESPTAEPDDRSPTGRGAAGDRRAHGIDSGSEPEVASARHNEKQSLGAGFVALIVIVIALVVLGLSSVLSIVSS